MILSKKNELFVNNELLLFYHSFFVLENEYLIMRH